MDSPAAGIRSTRGSRIAWWSIACGVASILVFVVALTWFSNYQAMRIYSQLLNGGVALLGANVVLGVVAFIRGRSRTAPRATAVKWAFGLALALLASFATFVGLVVYAFTHCPDGVC